MHEADSERKLCSCSRLALLRKTDLYQCKNLKIYKFLFCEILKRKQEDEAIDPLHCFERFSLIAIFSFLLLVGCLEYSIQLCLVETLGVIILQADVISIIFGSNSTCPALLMHHFFQNIFEIKIKFLTRSVVTF